jgi:hypothetical protein
MALPPPLVRPTRHPLKWAWNHLQLIVAALVLAHIGTLIVVGGYYLLFQTIGPVKYHWDNLFSHDVGLLSAHDWSSWRHLLRNVYEGVLGGTLVQLVVWNHFRRGVRRPPTWLDRLEIKLHVPNVKDARGLKSGQLFALPFLVVIYAVPGFLVGAGVVALIKQGLNHPELLHGLGPGPTRWDHIRTLWTSNYDQKLVGFFASVFMARRVMRGVADDLQGYFAARRLALGGSRRWYDLPNFRARMNDMSPEAVQAIDAKTGNWVPTILSAAILLGLALGGFGYYVLAYIA